MGRGVGVEVPLLHRVDLAEVRRIDWQTRFLPLSDADVLAVWCRSFDAETVFDTAAQEVVLHFLHFDLALIVRSLNDYVYPSSLFAVLLHDHDAAMRVMEAWSAVDNARDALQRVPSWALEHVLTSSTYRNLGTWAASVLSSQAAVQEP